MVISEIGIYVDNLDTYLKYISNKTVRSVSTINSRHYQTTIKIEFSMYEFGV